VVLHLVDRLDAHVPIGHNGDVHLLRYKAGSGTASWTLGWT
jgi:hypothetical protein